MPEFTHLDEEGRVRMVDVTSKKATVRTALAAAVVRMRPETNALIRETIEAGSVARDLAPLALARTA